MEALKFDPNTMELPLHYTRRESMIEFEDARCDAMFDAEEIIKMWNITCEHDKCTELANFYNCG